MAVVVQFSDCHLRMDPASDVGSPDRGLRAAVDAAIGIAPSAVLLTGDIADDGSAEAYHRVRIELARLKCPVLATAGNHDIAERVVAEFGGEQEVVVDGWRLLLADTAVAGRESGVVDADALAHRLSDDARPTIIALHHPPMAPSTHQDFQLDGHDDLLRILRGFDSVRAVVSGHLHQPFEYLSGTIRLIGCPSTWVAALHDGDSYRLIEGGTGFHVLDLGDDGSVHVTMVPTHG